MRFYTSVLSALLAASGLISSQSLATASGLREESADATSYTPQLIAQVEPGIVEGRRVFGSEVIDAMRVCAQLVSNLHLMTCIDQPAIWDGSIASFRMSLAPGDYYFFSYLEEDDGYFFYYAPSMFGSANSRPIVVKVRSGQTTSGIIVSNGSTCSNYPQFCIAPPSSGTPATSSSQSGTAADSSSQSNDVPPDLIPAAYYRGAYVSVFEHNGQFCYVGFSRNGQLIASISEDSEQPNIYRFDDPDHRDTRIFQVDATTLSYGGGEYERVNDVQPFSQVGSNIQACLTSEVPYFEAEEHTGRQRPSR
ncbi:hypothetical protein S7335_519 [Synechococcus sp. PCC 7335]|uniref:hypothetical protein n=1 Tax=Synechococcus sp. (strain ATCC 29403 / PCC 7335) TaxID=91464 RepID=UPI00017EBCB3|nr:hypothetical protein [Synechococcus sp. PCC 7335]EDX82922.1 hypothetical protein S7335_100 [Synechococcus sp. PCC 7335]EDX83339.1 hypothetical protein S7335_519 [Synechococcus sp. PCC 7335]